MMLLPHLSVTVLQIIVLTVLVLLLWGITREDG